MRRANVGSDTGSIVVFLLKMDLPARTNAVRGQHIDFHISKGLISNSDLKSTHTQRVGGRERRVGEEEGEVKRERGSEREREGRWRGEKGEGEERKEILTSRQGRGVTSGRITLRYSLTPVKIESLNNQLKPSCSTGLTQHSQQ